MPGVAITDAGIAALREMFASRLETLSQIVIKARVHFGDEAFLTRRLAPDMFPFGAQVGFTCAQAHNFALFCQNRDTQHADINLTSLGQVESAVSDAQRMLAAGGGDDGKFLEIKRVQLGAEGYCELSGYQYIHEFLLPNFYFHLVTAYDILRAAGMELGKKDFLRHLGPHVRRT